MVYNGQRQTIRIISDMNSTYDLSKSQIHIRRDNRDMLETGEKFTEARKQEVALRIREARLKAHFTQEQVANLLGCSVPRYNRIERAESEITILEADRLARAFNVPVTFFLRQLAEYA